jgi:hypothetical protein
MRVSSCALVALACTVLASCGGGGGGGGNSSSGGNAGGSLTVSTTTLTFVAGGVDSPAPIPQTISGTVSGVTSGTLYVLVTGNGPAISSISSVSINGSTGSAIVSVPSPSVLGPGTHTGTITVRACRDDASCNSGNLTGSPRIIDVVYHVAFMSSSAASLSYSIGNNTVAADLARNVAIAGAPPQTFSATDNADWLSVPATGNTGAQLAPTIVTSVTDTMFNGVYTAEIVLRPNTAGNSVTLPVTLTINRTSVNHVSPYVAYAGSALPVIIRGDLLGLVTIQGVTFGDIPAQSFNVVNDTEIRATPPAGLAPGRYPVRVLTNFAGTRQNAEYVVVNAPQLSAATLAYPVMERPVAKGMVFDAERAALGVSLHEANGQTSFLHYRYANGQWQPYTRLPLTNHFSSSLTADGREWILGSYRDVLHVDPVTLATSATIASPINGCCDPAMLNKFSLSNDGVVAMFGDYLQTLCGATLYLYEPRSRRFRTVPDYRPCISWMGASGDGSRLLVHPSASSANTPVLALDTAAGTLNPTSLSLNSTYEPQLGRAGSRIVLDRTRVYDASLAYIGNLPASTDASIVSPDGTRAYTFEDTGVVMRTFDLLAAPVNGIMREIGVAIPLAGNPGFDDIWPERFRMATTPDGRAVFFAGGLCVVVQPTP